MFFLLLNAGSSSLKGALVRVADGQVTASVLADWAGDTNRYRYTPPDGREVREVVPWRGHAAAVERFVSDLSEADAAPLSNRSRLRAVGHRVVHGGEFTSSLRVDAAVRERIQALAELAPLHNPPSLETLAAAEAALPDVPHVAVFDTAFHATLPPEARTYPTPQQWTSDWGIRRYGFHGLSHAYCARRAAGILKRPAEELRLVICHLGHGCSAAAVHHGRCVETTMGFTPLEGLMMATRSGSIDPGAILYVQRRYGLTPEVVERILNRESGLLGVSGVSPDMREVLNAAASGHAPAQLALAMYARRVRQAVGSLAVTMGGLDALIFTAGVGENAASMRARICEGLDCLGLQLDADKNSTAAPDADVSRSESNARILIIATREDVTMFEEVKRTIEAT